jgi:hypothetical protein
VNDMKFTTAGEYMSDESHLPVTGKLSDKSYSSGRLFSFGCSFTSYHWPTWADIAGKNFDVFENWGQIGGGNAFIFYSLCEAIKRASIGANDTVAVMWTSISREDRWTRKDGWLTVGSIYNQQVYDNEFVKKYADPTGYLIRDLALISAAKTILTSIGCTWKFFSMVPFEYHDDSDNRNECFFTIDQEIVDLYKNDLDNIGPSVFKIVFNNDWYSRPGFVDLNSLKSRYNLCRGKDWPSWQEFLCNTTKNCRHGIRKEIQEEFKFERDLIRTDLHPTPLEHSEYLQTVWPDLPVDITWVNEINDMTLKSQSLDSKWDRAGPLKRF